AWRVRGGGPGRGGGWGERGGPGDTKGGRRGLGGQTAPPKAGGGAPSAISSRWCARQSIWPRRKRAELSPPILVPQEFSKQTRRISPARCRLTLGAAREDRVRA